MLLDLLLGSCGWEGVMWQQRVIGPGQMGPHSHTITGLLDNYGTGEDCLVINWTGAGMWNDQPCSEEKRFVCKMDI